MTTPSRLRLFAAAVTPLLAVLALPAGAQAACAIRGDADEQVRGAAAAFVGEAVERRGDRFLFRVRTAVKGGLGETVEVRVGEEPGSSVSLRPRPGDVIGLVALTGRDGVLETNACLTLPPERLEELARGEDPCPDARLTAVRLRPMRGDRRAVRLTLTTTGAASTVRVSWGDGTTTDAVPLARRPAGGHAPVRAHRAGPPRHRHGVEHAAGLRDASVAARRAPLARLIDRPPSRRPRPTLPPCGPPRRSRTPPEARAHRT
jgi:hypothetical protein